MLGATAAGVS